MSTEQPEINSGQGWSQDSQIGGLERDVRRARLAQAAHFDALVDVRDAQTLRLAALHEDLKKKTAADSRLAALLPLQMEGGFPPRLWVDNVSYVIMEPDPRTFRLVRQAASGHETVLETREMREMVAKLREYASHSLIEAQRSGNFMENDNGRLSPQIVMAWLTGFTFGVLGLLMIGVMTGRISF